MPVHSIKSLSALAAGISLLAVLAACSPEAGAPSAGSGTVGGSGPDAQASSGMPSIYIASRIETLRDGENPQRANYRQMLDVCREAGHPISELSPEEVELLGLTRLERWFGPDDYAIRLETWSYGTLGEMPDQICQFQIGRSGHHTHFDRIKTVAVDLATGERTQHEPELDVFERAAYDENEGRDPQQVAAARQRMGGVQTRTVEGQTCEHAMVDKTEVCTWSGGRQWGFGTLMPALLQTDHRTALRSRIILEQTPHGPAYQTVRTEAFVVGAPLDQAALQPRP